MLTRVNKATLFVSMVFRPKMRTFAPIIYK